MTAIPLHATCNFSKLEAHKKQINQWEADVKIPPRPRPQAFPYGAHWV